MWRVKLVGPAADECLKLLDVCEIDVAQTSDHVDTVIFAFSNPDMIADLLKDAHPATPHTLLLVYLRPDPVDDEKIGCRVVDAWVHQQRTHVCCYMWDKLFYQSDDRVSVHAKLSKHIPEAISCLKTINC